MDGQLHTSNRRFPLFDSLRAIAALSVLSVHLPFVQTRLAAQLGNGGRTDGVLWPYLVNGNAGVAIFFLISAFLLYRPFAQARYTADRPPAAGPFAARRAFRIV